MRSLSDTELKRLHRRWRQRPGGRVALLLDSVQTPFNVGAIVRLAAAQRVEHLYLAGATVAPDHAKAHKTSLGTERYLTWSTHPGEDDAVTAAREAGYFLLGLELADGAEPLHRLPLPADVCVALGHEHRGLSPSVLGACDAVAYIPQLGRVGSLNVAHAATIAVYELRRREWTALPDPP
ncbi:MAG TPA: TrmH family RNA methyltransferase [Acidimicrobiales bacterium]|nr:TrmH family RNA methyltransferase [Acidimicrobiales bacterium]